MTFGIRKILEKDAVQVFLRCVILQSTGSQYYQSIYGARNPYYLGSINSRILIAVT